VKACRDLPGYELFFSAITVLGEAGMWLIALALGFFMKRWREIAAVLIIVILFGTVINEDLKGIIRRPRPDNAVVPGYFSTHSYSFPSGHTQTVFAIATVLSAFLAVRYNLITFLLAIAVGMSRMYLGVHYFTDVLGGAAAGILLGLLALYAMHRFGLLKNGGIIRFVPRPTAKRQGNVPGANTFKYAAVALTAGFIISLAAFFLSWYLLSLTVVAITYIIILWLPSTSIPALSTSLYRHR
jgi:undecaprenyl-diphosphatase